MRAFAFWITHSYLRTRTLHLALGLPVGAHVMLEAEIDGAPCKRAYTPTSSVTAQGFFELVVKVYAGGRMSGWLDSLAIGERVAVFGPFGRLCYLGQGRILVQGDASEEREVKCVEEIGFICGGSGITPAWQVMRAALDDVRDTTRFSVLHTCTRKPVDMLTCVSIYVCM